MDEITLDGKTYVSSKRAAAITGYAKDYVGQLCREGRVEARLVGRNWYILESSIREHRFGPDTSKEPVKDENTKWESATYASETPSAIPTFESVQKIYREEPLETATAHSETVLEMQNAWQDWFSSKNITKPTEEVLLESPEIIEEREESTTEAVQIHEIPEDEPAEVVHLTKVAPPMPRDIARELEYRPENAETYVPAETQEEIVPIHRSFAVPPRPVQTQPYIHQPRYTPQEPVYASSHPEGRILHERRVPKKKKPSVALQALFITVAGIAIAVALIGSGKIDSFLQQNRIQYAPINFLGGETVVNKPTK